MKFDETFVATNDVWWSDDWITGSIEVILIKHGWQNKNLTYFSGNLIENMSKVLLGYY